MYWSSRTLVIGVSLGVAMGWRHSVKAGALLLYGQRHMGKTSLLRNLGQLLPRTVVPLFVDGQRLNSLASPASRSRTNGCCWPWSP